LYTKFIKILSTQVIGAKAFTKTKKSSIGLGSFFTAWCCNNQQSKALHAQQNSDVRERHHVGYDQWRTQKISKGKAKFRHNRVTPQINFRRSAEGKTILRGSGVMPPGKICKITPRNTHFCAFWKQVLV